MGNRKNNQPIDRRESPLTPERVAVFLENLAETGIAVTAARAASPGSTHIDGAASTFYGLKRRDPHFAAQWSQALEVADGALLAEARRRAVSGTKKGIYFKGERITETDPETGEQVKISETEFSDRLLELLLKARFPRLFIDRKAIEHYSAPSGWVISSEDLNALNEAQTEALTQIMSTIMVARNEIVADPMLVDITPEPTMIESEAETIEEVFPY